LAGNKEKEIAGEAEDEGLQGWGAVQQLTFRISIVFLIQDKQRDSI
jgi:hypothetical protein